MRHLFSLDGPFARIMSTVADLVLINLLWLICSLPLITIGAASVAGHYACQKLIKAEGSIVRNFFASFKLNFKQATLAWLLIVLVAVCLFFDFSFLLPLTFPGKEIVVTVLWLAVLLSALIAQYLFPLLAQFDNTLRQMLINSLQFALIHLKTSILLVLPVLLMALLLIFNTQLFIRLGIVWLLLGFSLPAYLQNKLLTKVFAPFLTNETSAE